MNSIKDLKQALADEVRRLQPPPGLETRVLQQALRDSHRVVQPPGADRDGAVRRWDSKASGSPRLTAMVAAVIALAIVASLVLAAREFRQATSPSPANQGPAAAVLPVDEQWYWSAQDAAVLVDSNAGDRFAFPTIEITHDGGRTWISTTFQSTIGVVGDVPVIRWFDSRHLILYSERGFIYSTTDGGEHWTFSSVGPVTTLPEPAPQPENAYFLTADEGWTLCPTTAGCHSGTNPSSDYTLYRSLDGGTHWESLGHGFTSSHVEPSGIVFADADHGFVGTYSSDGVAALYETADGGRTWRLVRIPAAVAGEPTGNATTELPIMFDNRGVVVVRTNGEVSTYTTADYGLTWGSPHALPGVTLDGRCCAPSLSTDGWANWWAVDGVGKLFRSRDQGKTWEHITAALGSGMVLNSAKAVGGNVLWGSAQTASNPHTLPVLSVDGGKTWSVVKLSPVQPRVVGPPDSPPFTNPGCRFAC